MDQLRARDPESTLLYDLVDGMRVPRPPDFSSNGYEVITGLRRSYVTVYLAANKLLADVIDQQLAFLLPKAVAKEFIGNLHLAAAHWTVMKGKPCGRSISDMTFVTGMSLNTPRQQQPQRNDMA